MASSMIHLAITACMEKTAVFKDISRLRLGAILPDGAVGGNSHLKISICNDTRFTYDLESFRERYGEQMQEDDLYLGYYLHLVQDTFFRRFIYGEHHFNSAIPGNIEKLHHDYAVTNCHVARVYGLMPGMVQGADFSAEPICALADFDVPELVRKVEQQFFPIQEEQTFFFTPEMAEELVTHSTAFCKEELHMLRNGGGLDSRAWSWERFTH